MSDTSSLDEVELKAMVPDLAAARARVEAAGGQLVFEGRLEDRRYDFPTRLLSAQDHVLRLRVYRTPQDSQAALDWKGRTRYENSYKVREELSAGTTDGDTLRTIIERLGLVVIREIDRDITQYDLHGTMIRFEEYPRMDVLVEVEGRPEGIEEAVRVLQLPRDQFTTERLADFVARFEARTGERAAVSTSELHGDYRFSSRDS